MKTNPFFLCVKRWVCLEFLLHKEHAVFFFKIVRLWIVEFPGGFSGKLRSTKNYPAAETSQTEVVAPLRNLRLMVPRWLALMRMVWQPFGVLAAGRCFKGARKKMGFFRSIFGSCGASIISVCIYTLYRSISQKRIMNRVEGNTWMIPTKGNKLVSLLIFRILK